MKTPELSILTPLHRPGNAFIAETYASLQAQRNTPSWEWIILTNSGGKVPPNIAKDPRVRIIAAHSKLIGIGALKAKLAEGAKAPYMVELDADDLLAPNALRLIHETLDYDDADFVYSDFAEFIDKTWAPAVPFRADCGWKQYPVMFQGHELSATFAPPVTAHNIRRVEWSPNHVRAWRSNTYRDVGGHDASLPVADDHDLIVRFFLAGKRFAYIDECLYFYRVHPKNTVATHNAAIQAATNEVYNANIWKLAEKWADDNELKKIDLCGGIDTPTGYTPIDKRIASGNSTGVVCDLDGHWALPDSSVGVLRAHDAVEHLRDPIHTMNEAWRVLAPGGWLFIHVPSTNGLGAFCDPTHKSYWNKLSFRYYTDQRFARYVPEFGGKFQVSRVLEWYPDEWHRAENVPYAVAHLICVKDGFRAMGEFLW